MKTVKKKRNPLLLIIGWILLTYMLFSIISMFIKPLPYFAGLDSFFHKYQYQTRNSEFVIIETVGKDQLSDVERRYDVFIKNNNIEDKTLYRNFQIEIWKIWRW